MKGKSFTLIEMLVVVAIFSLVVGAISGIFISGISSQRRVLANQELLDQASYTLEYMGRALRMAKKELSTPATCLTAVGRGYNYQSLAPDRIRFLNYEGNCQEFYLENGQIKERRSIDNSDQNFQDPLPLTSNRLFVNSLKFNLSGENQTDNLQPRVTIFLEIHGEGKNPPLIQIQTAISQRDLDVYY